MQLRLQIKAKQRITETFLLKKNRDFAAVYNNNNMIWNQVDYVHTSESKRFRNAVKHRTAETSAHRKPNTASIKDQP